jgi:hypothetical protein
MLPIVGKCERKEQSLHEVPQRSWQIKIFHIAMIMNLQFQNTWISYSCKLIQRVLVLSVNGYWRAWRSHTVKPRQWSAVVCKNTAVDNESTKDVRSGPFHMKKEGTNNLPLSCLFLFHFSRRSPIVSRAPGLIIDIIFMMTLMCRTGY